MQCLACTFQVTQLHWLLIMQQNTSYVNQTCMIVASMQEHVVAEDRQQLKPTLL